MSESVLSQILSALQGIETRLGGLEAGQAALEAGQTSLQAGQTSLTEQLARVRADVMEHIDRLQNVVTEMRDEMAVFGGGVERVDRKVDSTRDEVRSLAEQYNYLFKRMQRIDERLRAVEEKQ